MHVLSLMNCQVSRVLVAFKINVHNIALMALAPNLKAVRGKTDFKLRPVTRTYIVRLLLEA